ncbi:glycine zipper 2TM domain-containing protein [Phenylobacterium sp.]|uniref:glycine zipper 2TM domain-containing protein n=1 Tax=Phenylobacterium sp. TaxID=1871053 RepID=UPI0035665911
MTKSSTFAKGALAAAAGLMALGAAATASAQPYGGPGYSNYDPCQREANGRGVTGALVGGAGGAVLGSQFAANGHRSDGSLLGGIVGAIAGAAIGHSTAACNTAPPRYADAPPPYREAPPPPVAYNEPPPPPAYDDAYYAPPPRYAERETVWAYGRHGMRLRVIEDRAGPDGCTVAESPVYMPDGRVDQRFVRVCPDYRGRYRVVD